MGKQRRLTNVAEKSPPQTSGNKHPFFPHKELSTKEPLAVEAHVFIVFRSMRSCATYSRYLERRFARARPIILTIQCTAARTLVCWRVPIPSYSASHVAYCINSKIKARTGHMAV